MNPNTFQGQVGIPDQADFVGMPDNFNNIHPEMNPNLVVNYPSGLPRNYPMQMNPYMMQNKMNGQNVPNVPERNQNLEKQNKNEENKERPLGGPAILEGQPEGDYSKSIETNNRPGAQEINGNIPIPNNSPGMNVPYNYPGMNYMQMYPGMYPGVHPTMFYNPNFYNWYNQQNPPKK